jgi:hypothetical protein
MSESKQGFKLICLKCDNSASTNKLSPPGGTRGKFTVKRNRVTGVYSLVCEECGNKATT